MTMVVEVKTEFSNADVSDWFVGMIEGNDMTRAWCRGLYQKKIGGYDLSKNLVWYGHAEAFAIPDWEIECHFDDPECDDEGDGTGRFLITPETLRAGLRLMAEKETSHWNDLVQENADAITYDVLLQCVVLKDVVYG